jgi:hypothetical protein
LSGTLITVAGFIPIGLNSSAAGEYTISLFYVIADFAAVVLDRCRAVRADPWHDLPAQDDEAPFRRTGAGAKDISTAFC